VPEATEERGREGAPDGGEEGVSSSTAAAWSGFDARVLQAAAAAGGGEVDPVAAGGGERGCQEGGGHGDARGRHGAREAGRVAAACGVDGWI
jgi:hypothetical protein